MNQELFNGVCTALVTPFSDGKLDLPALKRLIERQIEGGVDALCVAGTTGECATLAEGEFCDLVSFTVKCVSGRLPVVVGVGSPSTALSCRRAEIAASLGANALLAVTPYYNRGTEDGIVLHFHRIADAAALPVIVYNVPSRTGVDLSTSLYLRIAEHTGIAGIKEAGAGYDRLIDLIGALGGRIPVYTGNDSGILSAIALGGRGVISVVSNLLPRETASLARMALSADMEGARALQYRLMPLIRALFAETSPAPIKCSLGLLGLCGEELRLPLTPVSPALRDRLVAILSSLSIK